MRRLPTPAAAQASFKGFGIWRFLFSAGFLAPCYWTGQLLVNTAVLCLETVRGAAAGWSAHAGAPSPLKIEAASCAQAFFTASNVLYFAMAIQRPATRTVQALLLLPLFIVVFHGARNLTAGSRTAYTTILRVGLCCHWPSAPSVRLPPALHRPHPLACGHQGWRPPRCTR